MLSNLFHTYYLLIIRESLFLFEGYVLVVNFIF